MLPKNLLSPLLGLAFFSLLGTSMAGAQKDNSIAAVKSEIQVVGGLSTGNLHLFGYSDNRQIMPLGVEYDCYCLGGLLRSRVAYVAELLPVVLLDEPATYGVNGKALTADRQQQYGAGASPVGLRPMWRKPGQFQPYLVGKGGVLYFKNRVLSTQGTHLQWSAEFGAGLEKAVTNRMGYRIAYNDFHFSNGNIGRHNPGIDLMEIQASLTVRLRAQ